MTLATVLTGWGLALMLAACLVGFAFVIAAPFGARFRPGEVIESVVVCAIVIVGLAELMAGLS